MDMTRLLLLIIATVLVVLWIWLAKKYEAEFKDLTDSIDPNEYRYPELFCVGFGIMKILHIDSRSKKARKRIKEISEVPAENEILSLPLQNDSMSLPEPVLRGLPKL